MERPTYRLQFTRCGQARCRACAGRDLAHGPFWFIGKKVGAGTRWIYLGDRRPAGVTAAEEARARTRADEDRAKRTRVAEKRKARSADGATRDGSARAARGQVRVQIDADLEQLQLSRGASAADIKAAFRRLSLQRHPDRPGGSLAAMQALNQAYGRLRAADVESQ